MVVSSAESMFVDSIERNWRLGVREVVDVRRLREDL